MIKNVILKMIDFYRNYLSLLKLPSCRYQPSCSQYARDAVVKHGPYVGLLKGILRILRCHPFSKSGFDPV